MKRAPWYSSVCVCMFVFADFLRQSSQFGFLEELQAKLGADEGQIMWDAFNDVFDCLPLTGIIGGLRRQCVCSFVQQVTKPYGHAATGGRIISMHGGLGPNVTTIEHIATIPKPLGAFSVPALWRNSRMFVVGLLSVACGVR